MTFIHLPLYSAVQPVLGVKSTLWWKTPTLIPRAGSERAFHLASEAGTKQRVKNARFRKLLKRMMFGEFGLGLIKTNVYSPM